MSHGGWAFNVIGGDNPQKLGVGDKPAATLMGALDAAIALLEIERSTLTSNPPDHDRASDWLEKQFSRGPFRTPACSESRG